MAQNILNITMSTTLDDKEENKNFYLLSEKEDRQLQEALKVIREKNAPVATEEAATAE